MKTPEEYIEDLHRIYGEQNGTKPHIGLLMNEALTELLKQVIADAGDLALEVKREGEGGEGSQEDQDQPPTPPSTDA